MSLIIEVPSLTYAPGSNIPGTMTLTGEKEVHVKEIFIILSGCCKSKMVSQDDVQENGSEYTSTLREKVRLFVFTRTLFQGPYTLQPNVTWPFTFELPRKCAATEFLGDIFCMMDTTLSSTSLCQLLLVLLVEVLGVIFAISWRQGYSSIG
jgi:hypothetical protein